jgi:hypothetical protein
VGSRSPKRTRTGPGAEARAEVTPATPNAAETPDAPAPEAARETPGAPAGSGPAAAETPLTPAPAAAAAAAAAAQTPAAPAPAPETPGATAAAAPAPETPGATAPDTPDADADADPLRRRYARGRARDEAIRQGLEPLAPGERPRAVTIAAIVAFAFATANVVATLTVDGLSTDRGDPTLFAVITTSVLVLAGVGMLARRYWAVLGFEIVLGLQIVVFSLALTRVQKWWLAIALTIAIGLLGWLFWKLIRAMARLQMPDRGSAQPTR